MKSGEFHRRGIKEEEKRPTLTHRVISIALIGEREQSLRSLRVQNKPKRFVAITERLGI